MDKHRKNPTSKKYFLLLMGDFSEPENEKLLLDLLLQLEPIISSQFMKYQKGDDFLLAHFESEDSKKDLSEFLNLVLGETLKNYMLFANSRNNIISLKPEIMDMLMDLENDYHEEDDDDDDDESIDISDIMSELENDSSPKSIFEQILKNQKFGKELPKPTLDELLDKGIENLTEKERELLYDYSKNI